MCVLKKRWFERDDVVSWILNIDISLSGHYHLGGSGKWR